MSLGVFATYFALALAVLALQARAVHWAALLIIATALGYSSGVLSGLAVLWIAALAAVCILYTGSLTAHRATSPRFARPDPLRFRRLAPSALTAVRAGAAAGIVVLAILLGVHGLPGFHNFLVIRDVVLSPGAAPYTQYLNFDKTAAGVLILGICYQAARHREGPGRSLATTANLGRASVLSAVPIIVANTGVLVVLSLAFGFLNFQPKWTPFFWLWASVNLLSTCMSEEAFFRGFLQRELQGWLTGRSYGPWIALTVSAVAFGLSHIAGGWLYALLATVAGIGYGLAFQRTGRIEASILAHFTLNATHFLLFTYPRTA